MVVLLDSRLEWAMASVNGVSTTGRSRGREAGRTAPKDSPPHFSFRVRLGLG